MCAKMSEVVGACAVVVAILVRRKQRRRKRGSILARTLQFSESIPPISAGLCLGDVAMYRHLV